MTEGDVTALLRARYGEQGRRYALLTGVGNGTGAGADRYCDAIAVSLWPSDGLEWHGHEIKVSRSDWLREMREPDKADAFARYCHRWWIVTPDKSIVAQGELRPGVGLMVARDGKLSVSVGAVKQEPKDPPRALLAAIMRRVMEAAPAEQETAALMRAVDEARTAMRSADHGAKRDRDTLEALKRSVAAFEAASGLRIDAYNGRRLGEQVALVQRMSLDLPQYIRSVEGMARNAHALSAGVQDALDAARALSEVQDG